MPSSVSRAPIKRKMDGYFPSSISSSASVFIFISDNFKNEIDARLCVCVCVCVYKLFSGTASLSCAMENDVIIASSCSNALVYIRPSGRSHAPAADPARAGAPSPVAGRPGTAGILPPFRPHNKQRQVNQSYSLWLTLVIARLW